MVVEVGDWEHACCGEAIERDQLVDFRCIRYTRPDGGVRLIESHHELDVPAVDRVRGRVTHIEVVHGDGTGRAILRVPSGAALRGFDEEDDGHLEDPWTGELVSSDGEEFLVTVRTADQAVVGRAQRACSSGDQASARWPAAGCRGRAAVDCTSRSIPGAWACRGHCTK